MVGIERGPALARSVAAWVFERLAYRPGSSDTLDTAVDTLLAGAGSCRDFSHLAITMCRALGVPARPVAVYAPGLSPMDFRTVLEARRGPGCEVLDPTRLAPRSALTRIATGRDATTSHSRRHSQAERNSCPAWSPPSSTANSRPTTTSLPSYWLSGLLSPTCRSVRS